MITEENALDYLIFQDKLNKPSDEISLVLLRMKYKGKLNEKELAIIFDKYFSGCPLCHTHMGNNCRDCPWYRFYSQEQYACERWLKDNNGSTQMSISELAMSGEDELIAKRIAMIEDWLTIIRKEQPR